MDNGPAKTFPDEMMGGKEEGEGGRGKGGKGGKGGGGC